MECPAEDAFHEKRNWKTDWVQPAGAQSQDLGAKAKSLEMASEALAGEDQPRSCTKAGQRHGAEQEFLSFQGDGNTWRGGGWRAL